MGPHMYGKGLFYTQLLMNVSEISYLSVKTTHFKIIVKLYIDNPILYQCY